jgi:hypothetical protein
MSTDVSEEHLSKQESSMKQAASGTGFLHGVFFSTEGGANMFFQNAYRSLMFFFLLSVASSWILSFRYSLFLFLKYLLASHLTSFRLSPFISLGSCNHCSLACFL